MALVMLPSDLPWWPTVNRKLTAIQKADDLDAVLENMQKIHDLCNVSLDPDDDKRDSTIFDGFRNFIEQDLKPDEKHHFMQDTVKSIARHAQNIKSLRPPRGLSFSLQQQSDNVELDRYFVAALLANAFFSTFPKRTEKTHPTLQDFNFTNFFSGLSSNSQKAKLRCFLHYFDWLDKQKQFTTDCIRVSRKVMNGKQWLTIEDWTECILPLCQIDVKHQGTIESSPDNAIQTVFTSARIGGNVLFNGNSQECLQYFTKPESLVSLLFFEALEDNEAVLVEDVYQLSRIMDPKNKAIFEVISDPRLISLSCIDAENYSVLPVDQFEEDNILRELNKCLLAFRQNTVCKILDNYDKRSKNKENNNGRLSPIGESGSNSPNDVSTTIVIRQPSTATINSSVETRSIDNDVERKRFWLSPKQGEVNRANSKGSVVSGPTASGRKGRFIVLGSSGECLPIKREPIRRKSSSLYSSCDSDEEYHSAKDSFDSDDDGDDARTNQSKESDTPEKRNSFVKRLKEALRQSSNYTDSTASSYAVGISISGSQDGEEAIRLRRGGSTGFVLTEDSLDENFYKDSLAQEQEWLDKFRSKRHAVLPRKDTHESSKYSFSTEYSSELEEVYEQFTRWMEDPVFKNEVKELGPRDEAVLNFANSLLKRTLSESFVGVPLTDGCALSTGMPGDDSSLQDYKQKRSKPVLNVKSLSLELAKYKHRLAAQLISQLGQKRQGRDPNLSPVATGNWGCGSTGMGDVQLKLIIQWMSASVAGLPILIYHTKGHRKLTKLDTLIRVLRDRKWTVGELAIATLEYAKAGLGVTDQLLDDSQCLFEKLIGI